MTVSEIIDTIDVNTSVDILISLHRKNYYEPGYILNSKKLSHHYHDIINHIKLPGVCKELHEIEYIESHDEFTGATIYKLIKDGIPLREWFKDNKYPYDILSSFNLIYPKHLDKCYVFSELLFEISFYSFPTKTVDI